MKLLILHLSDIHFDQKSANPALKKLPLVHKAVQNLESKIDGVIVVLSGDVAYAGQQKEYEIAVEAFSNFEVELKGALRVEKVHFVCVPGNHDCDFRNPRPTRDTIIQSLRGNQVTPPQIDHEMMSLCTVVQTEFYNFRDAIAYPTFQTPNILGIRY